MSTPADQPPRLAAIGERGLVDRIRSRFPAPPGLLPVGIGDDAAVAVPARGALEVLTTDSLVEGVHFDLSFCSLQDVGYKALAVNVSDIASMGATSRLALLSLVLPDRLTASQVEALLDGFGLMASQAGITLAGGNITASPGPLVVDVTVLGSVRPRKALTRSGGRPGDGLYVTGTIGAAAAGLRWLQAGGGSGGTGVPDENEMADCVARYLRPEPRFRVGALLGRNRAASACMDLSDGLADALLQVSAASGTGARVEAASLPVPPCAARWFTSQGTDALRAALSGGDDYELLFAVPEKRKGRLRSVLREARGVPVTRIGELTAATDIVLMRDGQPEPVPAGFTHF